MVRLIEGRHIEFKRGNTVRAGADGHLATGRLPLSVGVVPGCWILLPSRSASTRTDSMAEITGSAASVITAVVLLVISSHRCRSP